MKSPYREARRVCGRASLPAVLLVLALIAVAAGAGYWFAANRAGTSAPPVAAGTIPDGSATTVPPPPFRIKGTLLGSAGRAALVAVLEHGGSERPVVKVAEGETLEGYLLKSIETRRVYFEKDGARFMLLVGADRPSEPPEIPADAIQPAKQREPNVQISAPPPGFNLEQEQRNMQQLVDQIRQSPKLQEAKQRKIREMEEERAKSGAPTASPAPLP